MRGELHVEERGESLWFAPMERRVDEGRCAVCGESLRKETRHACPRCGLLHHESCWHWAGGCAAFGCGMRARRALQGARDRGEARRLPLGSRPSFALVAPSSLRRCGRTLAMVMAVTVLGLGVFALSYWAAPVLAPLGFGSTVLHELGERLRKEAVKKEERAG